MRALFLPALAALVLVGCGPKVGPVHGSRSLTYEALSSSRVAVCGVTTTASEADRSARVELAEALERILARERQDLTFLPSPTVRARVGENLHRSALEEFESTGALDPPTLAEIRGALGAEERWLLLARIQRHNVSRQIEEEDPDHDSRTRNSRFAATTTRRVHMAFQIYDLERARSAWSATIVGEGKTRNDYVRNEPPSYPEPVELADLLPDVFLKLARKLPRPSG